DPLLVPASDELQPLDLVEDELILALPVVPVTPGTEADESDWPASAEEQAQVPPFAGLAPLMEDYSREHIGAEIPRAIMAPLAVATTESFPEQSHGCAEVPRHPVPSWHASFP